VLDDSQAVRAEFHVMLGAGGELGRFIARSGVKRSFLSERGKLVGKDAVAVALFRLG
jgi:hypothetical protein